MAKAHPHSGPGRGFGSMTTHSLASHKAYMKRAAARGVVPHSASHSANKGKGVANHPSGHHAVKRDSHGRFAGSK